MASRKSKRACGVLAAKKAARDVEKYGRQVRVKLRDAEGRILEHYRVLSKASGRDWARERVRCQKRVKAELRKAEKKLVGQMRRRPLHSSALAAAAGVAVGAVLASLGRRK